MLRYARQTLVFAGVSIVLVFGLYQYSTEVAAKESRYPNDQAQRSPPTINKTVNRSSIENVRRHVADIKALSLSANKIGLPKIIHQVWTDDIVPNQFLENVKGLVRLNPPPEWKYYFWTQKSGRKLMERNYPSLLKLFDVSDNTQKADMIRLLAIHQYGGAYFDMDTVAVKPLKPFFENSSCSISPHPPEDYIIKDSIIRPILISNNVLLCRPFHPFYDEIIRLLEKQPLTCLYAIQCTGPFFVSHVYDEMREKKENYDILPKWVSYELFQDKIPTGSLNHPHTVCTGKKYHAAEVWRREMCDEWRRRGGSNRAISKLAYTYHTWFHVRTNKVTSDKKNVITNVVPHAILYEQTLVFAGVSIVLVFGLYQYSTEVAAKESRYPNDQAQRSPPTISKTVNRSSIENVRRHVADIKALSLSANKIGLPKIIHQVWTDNIVPNQFLENVKGLVRLNPPPEWKYYFWTQKSGRKLMERNYPSLLKLFDVSDNTQKADMIRLLAIHQYGGAYFDMDTVAVKPLKPFFENSSCSISPHPPEDYIIKDSIIRPILISNNVLLCRPFHPFYDEIIRLLEKQPLTCLYAIQCTGPFFVSHVYDEMREKKENYDILPKWVSYELFQDKIPTGSLNHPHTVCTGKKYHAAEVWRREMCDEWRRRGGSNRAISKLAYTYHTWFHVRTNKVTSDKKNVITNVVPHAILYE